MPGSTYHPLELHGDDPQIDRFREAAKDGDVLDEVIGLTLADTGIRAGEMTHKNPDWMTMNEDTFGIRIPLGAPCRVGAGPDNGQLNTHKKGQPCQHCRTMPDKWWAPDDADWRPKTKAAHRFIPIREEDTKSALKAYYSLNDRVASHQTVLKRVKNIADRAGIERNVTPTDLRNTYGTLLADRNFTAHEIKNLMGHATVEPATHYVKLSSRSMENTFDEKW